MKCQLKILECLKTRGTSSEESSTKYFVKTNQTKSKLAGKMERAKCCCSFTAGCKSALITIMSRPFIFSSHPFHPSFNHWPHQCRNANGNLWEKDAAHKNNKNPPTLSGTTTKRHHRHYSHDMGS